MLTDRRESVATNKHPLRAPVTSKPGALPGTVTLVGECGHNLVTYRGPWTPPQKRFRCTFCPPKATR